MTDQSIPAKQRALVLQGGGALGAYDAGVFQAIYEKLEPDESKPLFDVVAGTSSGAMNAAILIGHVAENHNSWKGSSDKLDDFWNYVSRAPGDMKIGISHGEAIPGFGNWWKYWHNANSDIASEEAARRYYSSKEFLYMGVPRVFFPLPPRTDNRFFDNFTLPNNIWYIFDNQPLKDSLQRFSSFPISTSFDKDKKQPRLLLVSVDVLEGAVVTFDSYPKIDGSRKSEYGELVNGDDSNNSGTKYTINYNEGIRLEHAIASGSVPINYDYTKIEADRLTIDNLGNKKMDKVERYFWDGGIASNTPLRELIQAHKDYWLDVRGIGKEDGQSIPDLEVIIVDVWPTKRENIPLDHDGQLNRNYDLLACDKTDYDEKVANMVSDYIKLAKDLIGLAKSNKISKEKIEAVLSQPAKSRHRSNLGRTFHDLIEGRFGVDIKRIERTSNLGDDISSKLSDYSTDTIKQLMEDGHNDALKLL